MSNLFLLLLNDVDISLQKLELRSMKLNQGEAIVLVITIVMG